jgi:hypothetical protein
MQPPRVRGRSVTVPLIRTRGGRGPVLFAGPMGGSDNRHVARVDAGCLHCHPQGGERKSACREASVCKKFFQGRGHGFRRLEARDMPGFWDLYEAAAQSIGHTAAFLGRPRDVLGTRHHQ